MAGDLIVGAYLDHAAPEHPAGAEWTIQDTFVWMTARGHDCRVATRHGYLRERVNGVLVYSGANDEELAQHFQACDVMVTQLGATMHAQLLAATYQTPLVQYVHSANQLEQLGVVASCSARVVFNAQHVADACSWWPGQSIVMRPPIDAARVRVEAPGACVTLVNLSHAKGGPALYRLAQAIEGTPFLGVMGAYGDQALTPNGLATSGENESASGLPANMRVMTPLRDIRGALAYTRVLLVLSHTETYGRVAGEAILSGIPVIATRTPGLVECLADAGQYADDERGVERLIRAAYTDEWQAWSACARTRAASNALRQERELRRFERHLKAINKEQPVMTL